MQFDLENSEGEWFTFFTSKVKEDGETVYDDPVDGAGRVCLRSATGEIMDNIRKQTQGKKKVEHVSNPKTRKMDRIEFYEQTPEQEIEERKMLWDYCIVEWEGLRDKNDAEIPVTTENKMKLMNVPVFARFIGRCLQLLLDSSGIYKEALEKNS